MFRTRSLMAALALSLSCTLGQAATSETRHSLPPLADAMAATDPQSPGYELLHAGYEAFIVKYTGKRMKSVKRELAVIDALNKMVADSEIKKLDRFGMGPKAHYVRPLALEADLISFSRKLTTAEIQAVLKELSTGTVFEYFVPDYPISLMDAEIKTGPNDPQLSEQWNYFEPVGGINLPTAWNIAQGKNIIVGVIDGGYVNHFDLSPNIVPGYSFTTRYRGPDAHDQGPASNGLWHGTHVAGTVAAVGNNALDIAGVAFAVKVQPVRMFSGSNAGNLSDLYDSIPWSAGVAVPKTPKNTTPAKVINMSFTLDIPCSALPPVQQAIDVAVNRGVTLVAAAGNGDKDALGFTPSGCSNVISVGATTREGGKAEFSNYGTPDDAGKPPAVTVSAPGQAILSLNNHGTTTPARSPDGDATASASGTSTASPHVAGVVALMQSARAAAKKPLLTPAQVRTILEKTARPLPIPPEPGKLMGAGIVDADAAVRSAVAH